MWAPSQGLRIWLYRHPVDMRKSFNGLSALARTTLNEDPNAGALFVFINRRKTQMKCLYFDTGGYCIWAKRLERGGFQVDFSMSDKVRVDLSTLRLLVDGIAPQLVHRFKR
jgi:transposase